MRMRTINKISLGATLLAFVLGSGCSKKETSSTETPGSTTVSFSGSLALTGTDGAAALTATAYQLYCVTFELTPNAGSADADTSGAFSEDMDGFASVPFGCFLRADNKVVGSIVFEAEDGSDTTFQVDAGSLSFDIVLDAKTGTVTAKNIVAKPLVGTESSENKLADASTLGLIKGAYHMECNPDNKMVDTLRGDELSGKTDAEKYEEKCPQDMGGENGMDLYLNDETRDDGKRFIGVWASQEAFDACVGDTGSEFDPNFRLEIDGTPYEMDYSSQANYEASLDAIFPELPEELQTSLFNAVLAQQEKRYGWCRQMDQYEVSIDNCKFYVPEPKMECWGTDPETGVEGPNQKCPYPQWYDTYSDIPESATFTGTALESSMKCSKDWLADSNIPKCPPDVEIDDEGFGEMVIYVNDDGEQVYFACDNDRNMKGPANSPTLAEEVSRFSPPGADQCDETDIAQYAGLKSGSVFELRRLITNVFSSNEGGGGDENICDRYTVPTGFSFASCSSTNRNNAACWQYQHMGMKVGNDGTLDVDSSNSRGWFPMDMTDDFCPTAAAGFTQENQYGPESQTACRTEFAGKSAAVQAAALIKVSLSWDVVSDLQCNGSASVQALIRSAQSSSCAARVRYEQMWLGNEGKVTMTCGGSETCYDDAGRYIGEIASRFALMKLKAGGNAFSMSDFNKYQYTNWDPETNEQELCTEFYQTTISSNDRNEEGGYVTEFEAIFDEKSDQNCEKVGQEETSSNLEEGGKDKGKGPFGFIFTRTE